MTPDFLPKHAGPDTFDAAHMAEILGKLGGAHVIPSKYGPVFTNPIISMPPEDGLMPLKFGGGHRWVDETVDDDTTLTQTDQRHGVVDRLLAEYEVDLSHVEDLESKLLGNLGVWLQDIDLRDIAQLPKGGKTPARIPKNIGEYQLIPITAPRHKKTSAIGGKDCLVPEGIRCDYGISSTGLPHLDTAVAIGLVFQGGLSAMASAFITKQAVPEVFIKQIQTVTKRADPDGADPRLKYSTGLYGGFRWRDTLVQAWIEVARNLDMGYVAVQSAHNSMWPGIRRRQEIGKLDPGYDAVASRMHFRQDWMTKDWHLSLDPSVPARRSLRSVVGGSALDMYISGDLAVQ